jgi:hypothetical protein
MAQGKPGKTHRLTGTGPGLARQYSAGRDFARFWNRTTPFIRAEPGLLAGHLDTLVPLVTFFQSEYIGRQYSAKGKQHAHCLFQK